MTILFASLLASLTALSPPDQPADHGPPVWGWDAHKMICQMAYWRLDDDTRVKVDALIDADPEFERFAESCLWADQVRGEDERYDRFTTAHYVNLPRGATSFDVDRDCAETYCVVEAVRDTRGALSDESLSPAERLEALKLLSHFVSDIHQPMHAGYGDDRGGNDTPVLLFGNDTNLHAAWDYGLIEHAGREWVYFATILHFDIRSVDANRWAGQLDPAVWAEESFGVVSESAYDLPEDRVIGQAYYDRHIGILESRMQQAAVRLAAILMQSLSDEGLE
ncbi:MAG: S1/P1 nuclease [Rhodothermales bacterium]|nr:S1/P1 nuclease [Rhodothermales bacterium]